LTLLHFGCGSVSGTVKEPSAVQCSLQDERFATSKIEAISDLNLVRAGWLFGVGTGVSSREAFSAASSVISAQLAVDVSSETRVSEAIDSKGAETSRVAVDIRSKTSKRLKSVSLIATCTDPSNGKLTLVAGFDHQSMLKRASANHRLLVDGWKGLLSQLRPTGGAVDLSKSSVLFEQLEKTSNGADFDELSPKQERSVARWKSDVYKELERLWSGVSVGEQTVTQTPSGRRIELVVSSNDLNVSGLELKPFVRFGFGTVNVQRPSDSNGLLIVTLSKMYANRSIELGFEKPHVARRFARKSYRPKSVTIDIDPDEGFNVVVDIDSKPLSDDPALVSLIQAWLKRALKSVPTSKKNVQVTVSTDAGSSIVLNNRRSLFRNVSVVAAGPFANHFQKKTRVEAWSATAEGLEDAWRAKARDYFRNGTLW
jgi:hypothetical protein